MYFTCKSINQLFRYSLDHVGVEQSLPVVFESSFYPNARFLGTVRKKIVISEKLQRNWLNMTSKSNASIDINGVFDEYLMMHPHYVAHFNSIMFDTSTGTSQMR